MTDKDEYMRRMDKQDEALDRLVEGQTAILLKMAEHRKEHEGVDPSIKELVGILKGIKFMRSATIALGSICGSLWIAWLWIKDHIKW